MPNLGVVHFGLAIVLVGLFAWKFSSSLWNLKGWATETTQSGDLRGGRFFVAWIVLATAAVCFVALLSFVQMQRT